jgi:hypothetical protein
MINKETFHNIILHNWDNSFKMELFHKDNYIIYLKKTIKKHSFSNYIGLLFIIMFSTFLTNILINII